MEAQVALPLLPEVPVEEETEVRTMELIQLQHREKRTLVAVVVADTCQPLAVPASQSSAITEGRLHNDFRHGKLRG